MPSHFRWRGSDDGRYRGTDPRARGRGGGHQPCGEADARGSFLRGPDGARRVRHGPDPRDAGPGHAPDDGRDPVGRAPRRAARRGVAARLPRGGDRGRAGLHRGRRRPAPPHGPDGRLPPGLPGRGGGGRRGRGARAIPRRRAGPDPRRARGRGRRDPRGRGVAARDPDGRCGERDPARDHPVRRGGRGQDPRGAPCRESGQGPGARAALAARVFFMDGRGWRAIFTGADGTIRSGWRLLLFVVLFAVFLLVGALFVGPVTVSPAGLFRQGVVLLAAALGAGSILIARADRRPPGALGFAWTRHVPWEIGIGLAIGGGSMALLVGLLLLTGGVVYTAEGGTVADWTVIVARDLAIFGVAAAAEEAVFRGYPFQVLVQAIGPVAATLLGSGAFAVAHAANPNVNAF